MYARIHSVSLSLTHTSSLVPHSERAIQLNPQYAEALAARGFLRQLLGSNLAALEDYSQALRLSPDNPTTLFNRAKLYTTMNRHADAVFCSLSISFHENLKSLWEYVTLTYLYVSFEKILDR